MCFLASFVKNVATVAAKHFPIWSHCSHSVGSTVVPVFDLRRCRLTKNRSDETTLWTKKSGNEKFLFRDQTEKT
jgi:hypothetical protein